MQPKPTNRSLLPRFLALLAGTALTVFERPVLAQEAAVVRPATQGKKLTLEQVLGLGRRPNFGTFARAAAWAPDGVHLVVGEAWFDAVSGAEVESSGESKPLATEPRQGRRGRRSGAGATRPGKLPEGSKNAREVSGSPDGTLTAFVEGHDLRIYAAEAGDLWPVTSDGGENVLNGVLDWVYQEEVYGRGTFRAHWWSPDSKHLAFLRLDEKGVKTFTVIDHIPASLDVDKTVKPEVEKYPKAGDPNPTVKLAIARPADRKVVWADLAGYEPDVIIARVGWTPDSANALVQIQNRIQTWLDLVAVDPATGAVRKLFREDSKCWVNVLEEPRWLADGTFLWLSERTGYKHLYHYDKDGKLLHTLTQGPWEVRNIERIDEKNSVVWFTAGKDDAIGSNLYRVPLAGGEITRLTQGKGTHAAELNGDGSLFLDIWSALDQPPVQRLCKADGSVVRVLAEAKKGDRDAWAFAMQKRLAVPARDGFELDAALIAPTEIVAGKKNPIWIETYSGPDAPSVREGWRVNLWYQFLAQQGIAVLEVNVRSASNKGREPTGTAYKNFGAQELRDLEDAIAYVCKENPWADAARVGITGWSYGGFMSAYALTHSKAFALGIAGAGVYDWRLYDTIYTERYMDTPQANRQGYKSSSVLEAAKGLSGHLVLLHGTMDDNVHLQNTIRLVYELQKAGKDFELMLYPKSRHGVGSQEQNVAMRKLIWKQIQTHLGGAR